MCPAKRIRQGVGWVRSGRGVCYFPSSVRRRGGHYSTLSFSLVMPHSWDLVHVAHCYPFSYTDLQRHLSWLAAAQPAASPRLARETLCASLAGNAVDVLTITAAPGDAGAAPLAHRRGVVLTGGLQLRARIGRLPVFVVA